MANICMFVFNSVSRDSRVIKEANSLNSFGHRVTIIGVSDNEFPDGQAVLDTGVIILRIPRLPEGRSRRLLARVLRRIRTDIDLFAVPFVVIYFIVAVLFVDMETRVVRVVNLLTWSIFIFSGLYLFRQHSRLAKLCKSILSISSKSELGNATIQITFRYFVELVKRKFPGVVLNHTERRSRERISRMVRLAHELTPDVVHCHDVHTLPIGAAMKELTGCKVIYDAHEIYEEVAQSNPSAAARYRRMHETYLPYVDSFITINKSIAEWYKRNYRTIPEPAVVMNATVYKKPFDYDGRLHKAAELPFEQKIMLYQGGYALKRGLEYIVRSAEFFPSDWTLVMMGWGRLEAELKLIADGIIKAHPGKRSVPAVKFLPPVPQGELVFWTAGATVGVIPYENIGLNHWLCTPNKLWEYPNAGVPLLVSPFPELRRPIEKYGHGWLLPESQEPHRLADQIASLGDDEIVRARNGCRKFSENESWEKYESRLRGVYDAIDIPTQV